MLGDETLRRRSVTSPGPVDDAVLRQFAGYHIKRAHNVIRSDLRKRLEPLGLRISTYSCLVLIAENPDVRQSELAQALDIERPNMVTILDEMEQFGWIRRARLATDRRAYALTVTALGKRLCAKAVSLDQQHENCLLAGLTDKDKKDLIRMLNIIEDGLETQQDDRK